MRIRVQADTLGTTHFAAATAKNAYVDGAPSTTPKLTPEGVPLWSLRLLVMGGELNVEVAAPTPPTWEPGTPVMIHGLVVDAYDRGRHTLRADRVTPVAASK